MKTRRLLPIVTCLVAVLSAGSVHADALLNGLAVNTEFGKEQFIAALYSDNLTTDAGEMLAHNGERRMELKVTADSISARSINSMWVEGMAINNPASALEARAEDLAQLNNMVRKRLRAGDVLTFSARQGEGTTVTLNGTVLGKIASDDFFSMLLRTWIGSIPLSTGFKTDLLAGGDVDSALSSRYTRIEPRDSRVEAVASWKAPAPPRPEVAAAGFDAPKPDGKVEPPPAATEPEPAQEQEQVAAAQDSAAKEEASASSSTPEPESKPTPKPVEKAEPAQVAKAAPPARDRVEEEEDEATEDMVTAESLLMRQRYISDVMRKTLQNVQYPRRALDRSQEGSIRLAVTIDRNGKLQDVKIAEESPFGLLNREAVASVKRASPFPALPKGIAGDTFAFGIPVSFRLQ